VIDLPPGTGDVSSRSRSRCRSRARSIVATPQQVALDDAQKAIAMFQKLEVPVLGMVENMSYFICPSCDARHEIFASGGARAKAEALGLPFLGAIPDSSVRPPGRRRGDPVLVSDPASPEAEAFRAVARQLAARLSIQAEGGAFRPRRFVRERR
jgi:ATP-binding protein involved in chromosome partitioning